MNNNLIIAITGGPGTGKTWLLRQLKHIFKNNLILCATTGIAASLLTDARTCHTRFRQTPIRNSIPVDFSNCWDLNQKRRIVFDRKILCIDEASMLEKKAVDYIKKFYPNYIIVLIGDPDQLPMVQTENEEKEDWTDIVFDYHYKLIGNHRIEDFELRNLLEFLLNNNVRGVSDIIRPRMIERDIALQKIYESQCISYTNNARKKINYETSGGFNVSDSIPFKVGARIQANLYKTGGGRRKFIDIKNDLHIQHHAIYKIIWYDEESKNYGVILEGYKVPFVMPLKEIKSNFILANCITAHKAQGQTLNKIIVDLDDIAERDLDVVFNELYVCLSRVKSIDDITFIKTDKSLLFKNPKITLKCKSSVKETTNEVLVNDLTLFFESFLKDEVSRKSHNNNWYAHLRDTCESLSLRRIAEATGIPKTNIERMLKKGMTKTDILERHGINSPIRQLSHNENGEQAETGQMAQTEPEIIAHNGNFTLVSSGTYRNHYATEYKYILNITNLADFEKASEYDHTASLFKNNRRANKNFLKANCIMLDFDENAISIDDFIKKYKTICFYLATSKSHNKEKNGKIEPRYHIYLPIPLTDDYESYSLMIKAAQIYFESCDVACKDVSRYFNGNIEAECFYNEGNCILNYLTGTIERLKEKRQAQESQQAKLSQQRTIANCEICEDDTDAYYQSLCVNHYMNNEVREGNRNQYMCRFVGLCDYKKIPIKWVYYQNKKVGLPENELKEIIERYYKGGE